MKHSMLFAFLMASICLNAQNNLLDSSVWTVGTGSVSGWAKYGATAENDRIDGTDGFGNTSVLWRSKPDGSGGPDGGFYSPQSNIDPSKTYRYTVWIKKTGTLGGNSYFGLYIRNSSGGHASLDLNGALKTNPYFWFGDLPELDKWYFFEGYVHPNSYSGPSIGKMYDGVTKQEITSANVVDYKFATDATKLQQRTILFGETNNSGYQYAWAPTIYEVNGQEPTIAELLGSSPPPSGGSGLWSASGSDAYFTNGAGQGNVGIGTATPDSPLSVNGTIRTQEVLVNLDNWPDYVFDQEYNLRSLEELKEFITANGHLPEVPDANSMHQDGAELGATTKVLLQKVEELTLYIIQEQHALEVLENEIKYFLDSN